MRDTTRTGGHILPTRVSPPPPLPNPQTLSQRHSPTSECCRPALNAVKHPRARSSSSPLHAVALILAAIMTLFDPWRLSPSARQ
jgi:hypothetical protein